MMKETKLEKTREIVDNFLSILGEWFHPDKNWERIEKTANEFLFEDIKYALSKAEEDGFEYGKTYNMSDEMRSHTKTRSEKEILMAEGIRVAIDEFERQVRCSEGEVSHLFIRKVREALSNLIK